MISVQVFRLDYDQMKNIGGSFRGQEAATQQTIQKLTKVIEQLRGGDWIGVGATAFYNEMDSEVLPALKRLQNAMTEGDKASKDIEKLQHDAESSIESLFRDILSRFGGA
jgi:WXG100 family type VII secretion target